MLYTDGTHLIADDLNELFKYANSIGLARCWYESHWRHPHFDLVNKKGKPIKSRNGVIPRERVMADERVMKVSDREIVDLCRVRYCFPQNQREKDEWEAFNGPGELEEKVDLNDLLQFKREK